MEVIIYTEQEFMMSKTIQIALALAFSSVFHIIHAMEPPPQPPSGYLFAPWRDGYRQKIQGCYFCANRNGPRILQLSEHYYLMIAELPYAQSGSMMIVPYEHTPDIQGLSVGVRANLALMLKKIAHTLLRVLDYQGLSVGINTGRVAGASVPEHLHIHIIPETPNNRFPDVVQMLLSQTHELHPESESLYQVVRAALRQPVHFLEPVALDSSNHDCSFCNLIAGRTSQSEQNLIILRLRNCFLMFSNHPLIRGHMIIVPRVHAAAPDLCSEHVLAEMLETCSTLASICPEALRNQGSNTAFNVGSRQLDGRPIGHFSVDVVPRFEGDISSLVLFGTQVISIDMKRLKQRIIDLWNQKHPHANL